MAHRKEVKMGFIGMGSRGSYLFTLYQKIKGYKVAALCDKIEALVQKAYKIADDPGITCYTDYRKMLKEADIDAVSIVVEPENNVNLVCEALDAGKHVICEVPLAYTIEDCWRIVTKVEKTGLKFQMAEQTRYLPFIQAWKKMIEEGRLGKILYVEGQYLHGMTEERFWVDSETGEKLTIQQAKNNPRAKKTRLWNMHHPILYLPHELSPILMLLDDQVEKVTCMATRKKSYRYEWFSQSDFEVALMHTKKGAVLRLVTGFTIPTYTQHWYHLIGTKGTVENARSKIDKMKMWFTDSYMNNPVEVNWEYTDGPAEAMLSGHGGADYYPVATFIESIIKNNTPPMDIYRAVETAAPAIIAAKSAEEGCRCLEVPDFRPNNRRKIGQMHAKLL